MTKLIDGDDGLPAEVVGPWAKEKHGYLSRYIDITRATRMKWLGPRGAGATYIDLFCGTGRAKIRTTGEWIEGGCVAAWRKSVEGGAPFSRVYIADLDRDRRSYAAERLRRHGAPVVEIEGDATQAAAWLAANANPHSLHFAFIDPYSLGAFRFEIVEYLSRLARIDMLVHVSKMDLQRNLGFNIERERSCFDAFAPGWREAVDVRGPQSSVRVAVFEYWQRLVAGAGVSTSAEMKLIRAEKGQPLYWLLLAAKHELAHRFWTVASQESQMGFGF